MYIPLQRRERGKEREGKIERGKRERVGERERERGEAKVASD